MRAFEKLVCGRSRAADIAITGASIAWDRRRPGREGAELETAWVCGLASEKLLYGSMERAAEMPKTIPLAKKGIGM